ncbi:hypothetical protein GCM10018962_75060 [Dactylosporangium matsuzakiense]|uniref:Uncharacterized protein n=1 Tax=Dactylosporangium matsuzakiense TaxID=53360 RepID=A0A9W6KWV2_9ACTN|nr:hypothetical protein GCM10017581_104380 [Dactylosporangium matsuzakiense]
MVAAEQGVEDRRTQLDGGGAGLIDVAFVAPTDRIRVFQDVAGAQVRRAGGQLGQAAGRCLRAGADRECGYRGDAVVGRAVLRVSVGAPPGGAYTVGVPKPTGSGWRRSPPAIAAAIGSAYGRTPSAPSTKSVVAAQQSAVRGPPQQVVPVANHLQPRQVRRDRPGPLRIGERAPRRGLTPVQRACTGRCCPAPRARVTVAG